MSTNEPSLVSDIENRQVVSSIEKRELISEIENKKGEELISKKLMESAFGKSDDPSVRRVQSRGKALFKNTSSLKNAFILSELLYRIGE
jgi:hypothetical protein